MSSQDPVLAIAIHDVDFHWGGNKDLKGHQFSFENLSFSVKKAEKVFLFGESGSGKSTLLGLITGTLLPTNSGRVEILGSDTGKMSPGKRDAFRAEHMGVIFQMFNLIPYLSAIDNIVLPLHFANQRSERAGSSEAARRERALELMERLGLSAGALATRKPSELSVGQQQRVAAARAFIGNPELIIADEPTSALDRNHQQEFMDLLFDLADGSGSTLVMVSHDGSLAKRFDRTVSLNPDTRSDPRMVTQ